MSKRSSKKTTPSQHEETVLSREALQGLLMLEDDSNPDFIGDLYQSFCRTAEEGLPLLLDAVRQHDAWRLSKKAHSLRSAAASLGSLRMAELCQSLEQGAGSPTTLDWDRLERQVEELAFEFERFKGVFERELQDVRNAS